MSYKIDISYQGGMSFKVNARQHELNIDLSEEKGGQDLGPNPPEIFIASLGSCIGVYIVNYLKNVKIDATGLKLVLMYQYSDDKTRIESIDIVIGGLKNDLGRRKDALLEVAKHCLIHKSIENHPNITIKIT